MLPKYLFCLLLLSSVKAHAQTPPHRKPTPKHRKPTPTAVLLQGIWAQQGEDENALFWVEGNRLTFVEFADEHLRYTLTPTKRKLTIFRPDSPPDVYYIKKLTRDSLVIMIGDMGPIWRLYRR